MESIPQLLSPGRSLTGKRRSDTSDRVRLNGLFARVWVLSLQRASQAQDLKELTALCNDFLPLYPKRVVDWQNYLSGKHAPSLNRGSGPGIVRILGAHFPSTLAIATHVLWKALDPALDCSVETTDRLLSELNSIVTQDFSSRRFDGRIERDWAVLRSPRRSFPQADALAMDYVACYLLLFRSCRKTSPPAVWVNTLDALAAALSRVPNSEELRDTGSEIEDYIDTVFLTPEIGCQWQAPSWPFYREHLARAELQSSGVAFRTDTAGKLKYSPLRSLGERVLYWLDDVPPPAVNPAHLNFGSDANGT